MGLRDIAKNQEVAISLEGRNVEEFFNENHDKSDGKFTSGSGGSGGWKDVSFGGKKYQSDDVKRRVTGATDDMVSPESRKALRNAKLKKVAIIAGAVALAAGVVFLGVQVNKVSKENAAAEARAATHQIPGSKLHFTRRWTDTDKNGKKLHVLDSSGKLTEEQAKGMLKQLKDISDREPLEGKAARIVVRGVHKQENRANAFVMNRPGARTINVNHDRLYGGNVENRINRGLSTILPYFSKVLTDKKGRHEGDYGRYTVVHEYGHVKDLHDQLKAITSDYSRGVKSSPLDRVLGTLGRRNSGPGASYNAKRQSVYNRNKLRLRMYGKTNGHEGYAESFAEYHLSSGQTRDAAAQNYAKEFGWRK